MNSIYLLGVEGSKSFDLIRQEQSYLMKLEISEDVRNWLLMHDVEVQSNGSRVFICNKVRYVDLGLKIQKDE